MDVLRDKELERSVASVAVGPISSKTFGLRPYKLNYLFIIRKVRKNRRGGEAFIFIFWINFRVFFVRFRGFLCFFVVLLLKNECGGRRL